MKWGGGNLERAADESHYDADSEQRLDRCARQFLRNRGEACRSRPAVNETDSKQCECARSAAKEEIIQVRFGRAKRSFVECGRGLNRKGERLRPERAQRT